MTDEAVTQGTGGSPASAAPREASPPAVPPADSPPVRTLAGVAQVGALALGVVYVIGLLIVNLHLGQYGLQSLDLARPEYALAGALWVLLAGAALWGVHSTVVAWKRLRTNGSPWRFLDWSIVVFGWGAPVWIILSGVGYFPAPDAPWWVRPATTALFVVTGASLYRAALTGQVLASNPVVYLEAATGHLDRLLNLIPFVLVVSLGIYAGGVYPDLPREFGGGRRPTVVLVLSQSTLIDWKAAGIPFAADTNTAGPATLLLETPASLVVVRPETWRERQYFRAPSSARTVSLDRKLVAAVVYLPAAPASTTDTTATPAAPAIPVPTPARPAPSLPPG